MMTLEPPRTLSGNAGKIGQVPDAEVWRAWGLSRPGLSRFLRIAQAAVGLKGEVEVLLAGDRTLRRLNREYRGKDKATDVLSFPAAEEFAGEHGGDLAISVETAKRQAEEHGHTLRDEVRAASCCMGCCIFRGWIMRRIGERWRSVRAELRGKLRLPNGLIARVEEPVPAEARAKAKVRSRFPEGMTERKTKATAEAKEEADPYGMTARKATAKAKATATTKALDAKDATLKGKGREVGRSGVRA